MIKNLQSFAVLDGLTESELQAISKICAPVTVPSGEMIFSAGERAQNFFLIRSGHVELRVDLQGIETRSEMLLDRKTKGDILGWSVMTSPNKYTLSAYAASDCDLWQIEHDELEHLCEENTRLGYVFMKNLARIVGQRFRRTRAMLLEELRHSEARQPS